VLFYLIVFAVIMVIGSLLRKPTGKMPQKENP